MAAGLTVSPAFAGEMSPKVLLAMTEEQSSRASQMAVEAEVTEDYYTAQHAFSLASEAAGWVAELSAMAQQMPDSELGHAAHSVAGKIRDVIAHTQITAGKIAATHPDPEVVHAANCLYKSCEFALAQFQD